MHFRLSTRHTRLLFLLFLILPTGCITDKVVDCEELLEIRFILNLDLQTNVRAAVDPAEINRIDLFVFDDRGLLAGVWTDVNPVLSERYSMSVSRMVPGDYRFVLWCGLQQCYHTVPGNFVVGQTSFEEARLLFSRNQGIAEEVLPLFHAESEVHILGNVMVQEVEMPLMQLHNRINLTTEGLIAPEEEYRVVITDNNGRYTFEAAFDDADTPFQYMAACHRDELQQPAAAITVLKLADHRSPTLQLINQTQDQEMYSANLIDLINSIDSIDFEETHTFDIHLAFRADMTVEISVNGWRVTEDEYEL